MLLNGTPFAFVIDLAALASRREYLKLDKWLTDKIREHGVSGTCPFVSTPNLFWLKYIKKLLFMMLGIEPRGWCILGKQEIAV
jgi:hypothetical protein